MGNAFDIGRGLRESPGFHVVARSVEAKRGVDPEMGKVNLVWDVLMERGLLKDCN